MGRVRQDQLCKLGASGAEIAFMPRHNLFDGKKLVIMGAFSVVLLFAQHHLAPCFHGARPTNTGISRLANIKRSLTLQIALLTRIYSAARNALGIARAKKMIAIRTNTDFAVSLAVIDGEV